MLKHLEQAMQADYALLLISRRFVSGMNCDVIDALLHCCRWVRSFLSEDHRGLDVLIDIEGAVLAQAFPEKVYDDGSEKVEGNAETAEASPEPKKKRGRKSSK